MTGGLDDDDDDADGVATQLRRLYEQAAAQVTSLLQEYPEASKLALAGVATAAVVGGVCLASLKRR